MAVLDILFHGCDKKVIKMKRKEKAAGNEPGTVPARVLGECRGYCSMV